MEKLPVIFTSLGIEVWPWIQEKLHIPLCSDTKGIVAWRGPDMVAATVFDQWTINSCRVHIVVEDRYVLRKLLEESAEYVFNTCERNILYGLTSAKDTKALSMFRRMGFVPKCCLQDAYGRGHDAILQEGRKENCRYWKRASRMLEQVA